MTLKCVRGGGAPQRKAGVMACSVRGGQDARSSFRMAPAGIPGPVGAEAVAHSPPTPTKATFPRKVASAFKAPLVPLESWGGPRSFCSRLHTSRGYGGLHPVVGRAHTFANPSHGLSAVGLLPCKWEPNCNDPSACACQVRGCGSQCALHNGSRVFDVDL